MNLAELSVEYHQSGDRLRARLRVLRRIARNEQNPQELFRLQRRIADLAILLRQVNELEELTARYYERGYKRDAKYTL